MTCRGKREIVVRDGIRDPRERVRETLALGITIVGGSGSGEPREAGLKPSMKGETLGVLGGCFAIRRTIVRGRVSVEVDNIRYRVVLSSVFLDAVLAWGGENETL